MLECTSKQKPTLKSLGKTINKESVGATPYVSTVIVGAVAAVRPGISVLKAVVKIKVLNIADQPKSTL